MERGDGRKERGDKDKGRESEKGKEGGEVGEN